MSRKSEGGHLLVRPGEEKRLNKLGEVMAWACEEVEVEVEVEERREDSKE